MLQGYVHPDFGKVAETLSGQLPRNRAGGAALTVYHRGQCVVDIWGGTRNRDGDPWRSDTLSMSFSTTKGVAATLIHILADEGLLEYDDPVSKHWPEFGQKSKQDITIRQLLCHEAGLYHIRHMIEDAEQMMDWDYMIGALERARPVHRPSETHGYHALTFGWLIGELIHRVTNKPFSQVLEEKITRPLGLDGMYVGLPELEFARRAQLVNSVGGGKDSANIERHIRGIFFKTLNQGLKLASINLDQTIAAIVPKGAVYLDFNHKDFVSSCIPAANGMFTARSLAKLYATLANGGEMDGTRIISRAAIHNMLQIQNRSRGHVIPVPMHWRLGYHRVFSLSHDTSTCFGHFGLGGSGAWADPARGLAVGYILNSGVGTPFGDSRILNLSSAIFRCAEKRYLHAHQEEIRGIGPFFPRDRRLHYGTAKRLVSGVLPKRRRSDSPAI
ncbi:MAG: beta-lactamase family protein [Pseudomonadales bacterium]|nr:beta-lactamase family protein [Pseudomonadales bacterium]